jgi:amphi-Trp domain-containing protein
MTPLGQMHSEELSRAQAADRLAQVAEQLREGTVVAGDDTVAVPERVYFEIELEDGELKIELKWAGALADDVEHEDEDEEEIVYGEAVDDEDDEDDSEDDTEDRDLFI